MRILYFSRDYTTHDHRFLAALAKTGDEISFLRLEQRGHSLEDRPLPEQVQQIPWAGGQAPAGWRDGPRLLRALRGVLRQVQPDLVLAGPLQRSAFLAALAGFRPLVSMSWGYDLIFDAQKNALWRWATRFTLQRSAAMVGDCATIRKLAVAQGMPDERIVTFPWGIDLAHFSPAQPPAARPAERPFTILSTRSWEPIYGVDVIARAFVQAARQQPDLRLVMLGSGSQAGLLRHIFGSAGLESQVVMPNQISYANLPAYYRAADLYVSASHSDGTSISLLEALACGTPALVSDIPGNCEWVTPGENGWLFADGSVEALAQGFLRAAGDRAALAHMGRAARQTAEARADWEQNFRKLGRAFDLALQRPGAQGRTL